MDLLQCYREIPLLSGHPGVHGNMGTTLVLEELSGKLGLASIKCMYFKSLF